MTVPSVLALLVIPAIINFANVQGCLPPAPQCKCYFRYYPCANGFSYGCYKGKCWAQCTAILAGCAEWCYTKYKGSGSPMYCTSNCDCVEAADCSRTKCNGGCTLAESKWQEYRTLLLLGNK